MGFLNRLFGRTGDRAGATPPDADPELDRLISSALAHPESADPETGRQWSRLERAIADADAAAAADPAPQGEGAGSAFQTRPLRGLIPRLGIGLAVIVGIALLAVFQLMRHQPRHISTARGEQSVVSLPDGSEVQLNHTSTLDFDIPGFDHDRRVRLTGEAFFSVRNGDSPFRVVTDAGTVTVTGTKFNVRVRDGQYEVGVTEGSVRTIVPVVSGDTAITLAAGQALSGRRQAQFPDVRKIEHANYPGWTGRMLIFTRMDLRTVCDEVMNYFDVSITLEDPSIGGLSVTGAFDAHDAGSVIASICLLTGRNFRHEGDAYILY